MSGYKRVNIDYDKQALIDLYISKEKSIKNYIQKASLNELDLSNPAINHVLDQLPFVPKVVDSIYLVELVASSAPHIMEQNSALVMLPLVETPQMILKTYDFADVPSKDADQQLLKALYVKEEIVIDQPIAIDTSSISSTHVKEPVMALVINVPINVLWNSIIENDDLTQITATIVEE
jgi:hypothetical protein